MMKRTAIIRTAMVFVVVLLAISVILKRNRVVTLEPGAQAGFSFTTNEGTITLTEYTGSNSAVTIPCTINGLPVTSIGVMAFASRTNVSSVTIPDSITNIDEMAFDNSGLTNIVIGKSIARIKTGTFSCASSLATVTISAGVKAIEGHAFSYCTNLSAVFFDGDAPRAEPSAFSRDSQATIYYRQGTQGWSPTYAGCPTALFEP